MAVSDDFTVLTDEELRRLDAAYEPFPSFANWVAKTVVGEPEWDEFARLLAVRRESVSDEDVAAARTFVMRAAAVDTGAIEGLYTTDRGFTFSVAQQALHWERNLAERGPLALELFEAQLRTYELVLDAATKNLPVTEAWIRRLHEELCSPQETYKVYTPVGVQQHPLPRGAYKHHPNHVRLPQGGAHSYAPVDVVADEMHRLVSELESGEFAAAHPVHQASYAHYALVVVHPFADGNGRVARALASTYYYRALSLPLIVLDEQRDDYLDALGAADGGELQTLVSFFGERGIEAVQLVTDSLGRRPSPSPDEAAGELARVLRTRAGLTHRELDVLATKCLDLLRDELAAAINEVGFPLGVGPSWSGGGGSTPARDGYRQTATANDPHFDLTITSQPPAAAEGRRRFFVYVATELDSTFAFMIQEMSGPEFPIRLKEVSPAPTPAFRLRLRRWAEQIVGDMLEAVAQQAAASLREGGFR